MKIVYTKKYGKRKVVLSEHEFLEFMKRFNPVLTKREREIQARYQKCSTCGAFDRQCVGCTFRKFRTARDWYGCAALLRLVFGGSYHLRLNLGYISWFNEKRARMELKMITDELNTFKKEVRR